MVKTKSGTHRLVLCALTTALAACSGDKGDTGDPGVNGTVGAKGTDGMNGMPGMDGIDGMDGMRGMPGMNGMPGTNGMNGSNGDALVLSVFAQRGFEISPFALDATTMTTTTAEAVGRGSYLVNAVGDCNGCHANQQPMGPPRFLAGGTAFALPGGVVYARNLTPHSPTGLRLTEAEFVEAMRTGRDFRNAGEALIVMPWLNMRWMTEVDLRAIYAYLRQVPPVQNPIPADIKGPFAQQQPLPYPTTYNEGDVVRPLPPETAPDPNNVRRGLAIQPLAVPAALSSRDADESIVARYGRGSYLINAIASCNDCHTNPARDLNPMSPTFLHVNTAGYLAGGAVFEVPPGLNALLRQRYAMASNLSGEGNSHLTNFTDFLETFTEGTHIAPNGARRPLGWPMPWSIFRNMTIDDLASIYTYIRLVPRRTGVNDKVTQGPSRFCMAAADCNVGAGETCSAIGECVGATCTAASRCGACQVCTGSACASTSTTTECHLSGI